NCEHLTPGVVPIIDRLLSACHGLNILATSRQPIGVRGELVWSVPVLGTPKPSELPETILKSDSVRLFLNRSRRASDRLPAQPELVAVASICRRLDGLPLAI